MHLNFELARVIRIHGLGRDKDMTRSDLNSFRDGSSNIALPFIIASARRVGVLVANTSGSTRPTAPREPNIP